MTDTSIAISDEVWEELHQQKKRGESFDDVLRRVLGIEDAEPEPDPTTTDARARESMSQAGDQLLHNDIPGTVDEQAAQEAIAAVVDYLRETGSASMREIVVEVMPEHNLGYDVPDLDSGERYRGSWWRRVVKPALEQHEAIESPSGGASNWRYI